MGRSEEYAAVIDMLFFVMMFAFVLILSDDLQEIL